MVSAGSWIVVNTGEAVKVWGSNVSKAVCWGLRLMVQPQGGLQGADRSISLEITAD